VLNALRDAGADVFCVAAYGCILPDEVLTIAPFGCVNVHASLLPRWRGAAPIQRCILEGDDVTGVSIMRIGHGIDTGDYCAQATCSVSGKNADQLTQELANLGGNLLVDTLPKLASHEVAWTVQDEGLVTHAAKISKAELKLDPSASALDNVRRVLASSDTAPARCELVGKGARIVDASLIDMADGAAPSVQQGVLSVHGGRVFAGCADGAFEVLSVKPDGKRLMDARSWSAGLRGQDASWDLIS
jgi:methionyl-tRNA formyltransferase